MYATRREGRGEDTNRNLEIYIFLPTNTYIYVDIYKYVGQSAIRPLLTLSQLGLQIPSKINRPNEWKSSGKTERITSEDDSSNNTLHKKIVAMK